MNSEYSKEQLHQVKEKTVPILGDIEQKIEKKIEQIFPKKNKLKIEPTSRTQSGLDLYAELLMVTDCSIYNDHVVFSNSTNQDFVFNHMRIYFSHLFYSV